MIAQAGLWLVLVVLGVQGVVMALTALASGYDDYAVLRVSGGIGLVIAFTLLIGHIPTLTALGFAAAGPFVALVLCLTHSTRGRMFSRGPYADLIGGHRHASFLDAKASERGRRGGKSLSMFLCGERFEPLDAESHDVAGEYIASTILIGRDLYDVNLQAIIGWMPREPWLAVLTEEEVNAIKFAMRPAPPIEELLAAKARGEFLIHDAFGEKNLRSYVVANNPDLLTDPALASDGDLSPLHDRIALTSRARAVQWAWTVAVGAALPLAFAWAALAGYAAGGGN